MLRSFLTIGVLQLFTMLLLLVRTKALALLLGPEYVGAMAVTDKLLAVIMQPVALSFPFAALRFLPSEWSAGPERYGRLLRRMLSTLLVTTAIATFAAVIVTLTVPQLWGKELLKYRGAVLWAAMTLPVLTLVPFVQSAIAGRMREGAAMRFTLLHGLAFAISGAVGAWWKGLAGVYIIYAVLGPIVLIIGLRSALAGTRDAAHATARIDAPSQPQEPTGWLGLPPALWRFSTALLILTFIAPYAALRVHYTVLSDLGAQAAGYMQAAVGLSLSVRALLGSAHPVFLTPNVNRGGTPSDRLEWANAFQRTFLLLTIVLVPPLLMFSNVAVNLLYSHAFAPGARFAVFFVLAEVVTLISGTYQALILAFDHMVFHVIQNTIAQVLLATIALVLIPTIGIAGAGLGVLAAPLFLYVTTLVFLHRRHGLRLPRAIARLGFYTIVALAVAGAFGTFMPGFVISQAVLKVVVYGVTVAVAATFLTPAERQGLRGLVTSRRSAPTDGAEAAA